MLAKNFINRLWLKDPAIWKSDPTHKAVIANRLGWLDLPYSMKEYIPRIFKFAREIRQDKYSSVVLLGMGGSSLSSLVMRDILGIQKGSPKFYILDFTHPDAIFDITRKTDVSETLFIVSSKSGGTVETLSHYKYFYNLVKFKLAEKAGRNFIAITDKGTPLEKIAKDKDFRDIFLNPSDVGGRFSALSYFGLVPAACMGIDIKEFIAHSQKMAELCKQDDKNKNPALGLGMTLAASALKGRDKLTLIIQPEIYSLSYWIEQLVAESTGKEKKGIIPIAGEKLKFPAFYGADRVFMYIRLSNYKNKIIEDKLALLKRAGFTVIDIALENKMRLGAEFFKWELATCVAAAALGINPFDEPNVKESKDNTAKILDEFSKRCDMPKIEFDRSKKPLKQALKNLNKDGYVAMLCFVEQSRAVETNLAKAREFIANNFKLATLIGFGPRYLHSTGQLFKGGPDKGLFIFIISKNKNDIKVPGEPYSFKQLCLSQALGDIRSLQTRKRPVFVFSQNNLCSIF